MRAIGTIGFLILWVGGLSQAAQRYEFSRPLMGTEFRIVLYASDSLLAAQAAKKAFERVATLNTIMSDYQSDSELNRLSATAGSGERVAVSEELWLVLNEAKRISRQTKGAFDVSIGPLSKLWRRAFRQRTFPAQTKIDEAKSLVDYRNIRLFAKENRVKLKTKGMRLDLGGIAKGYAADEAYRVLVEEFGIRIALVDAGGDLVLGDTPPEKKGWEVMMGEGELEKILMLKNCAIATSGDTYKYLDHEGKRYSHIIHPKTGTGMIDRRQVSVICEKGIFADAWASSLSIYPIDQVPQKWFLLSKGPIFAQIIQQSQKHQHRIRWGAIPQTE